MLRVFAFTRIYFAYHQPLDPWLSCSPCMNTFDNLWIIFEKMINDRHYFVIELCERLNKLINEEMNKLKINVPMGDLL